MKSSQDLPPVAADATIQTRSTELAIFKSLPSVADIEARIQKLNETQARAELDASQTADAMAQALAFGEPIEELQRKSLMTRSVLDALPQALASLQSALAEAKRQVHLAEVARRRAQAEALAATLVKHAQSAAKALEALVEAAAKALAELPSGAADIQAFSDSEALAVDVVSRGGQRLKDMAAAVVAMPVDLQARALIAVTAFERTGR